MTVLDRALRTIVVAGLCSWGARPARAQDSAAGRQDFARCSVCHSTDGTNGTGPTLRGVVGRKAGTVADFHYSRAMKASNVTWDEAQLTEYLADPQKVVPGNVMPFAGIPDAKQRADVVAYLASLK
jgi:cytochrome c